MLLRYREYARHDERYSCQELDTGTSLSAPVLGSLLSRRVLYKALCLDIVLLTCL